MGRAVEQKQFNIKTFGIRYDERRWGKSKSERHTKTLEKHANTHSEIKNPIKRLFHRTFSSYSEELGPGFRHSLRLSSVVDAFVVVVVVGALRFTTLSDVALFVRARALSLCVFTVTFFAHFPYAINWSLRRNYN